MSMVHECIDQPSFPPEMSSQFMHINISTQGVEGYLPLLNV
jgi:hypothetical protein